MGLLRVATAEQARALWPAVRASRLFASAEEFESFRLAEPWRVRMTEKGEGVVMAAWRHHLEVLAIKGLWASPARIAAIVGECAAVAADHGYRSLLSPLLTVDSLSPYLESGFELAERIVVLQGLVDEVARAGGRAGIETRAAAPADIDAMETIDTACFDAFWGYGRPELAEALRAEHVIVATGSAGSVLGYASCAAYGGSVTVGRLAVDPAVQRRGVGTELLASCARWAAQSDAFALSLCTQEHNRASRALYAGAGMHELQDRYALAARVLRAEIVRPVTRMR